MLADTCKALLIAPRFDLPSFWNLDDACRISGRSCPVPPLGLITVAAMLPTNWSVRLVDRNAETLTDADLDWADLVLTGGMIPQRPDALRVIDLAHARGKPVVVGGPDATSSPQAYDRADFQVLGEAEDIVHDFVRTWESGARQGRFVAERFQADVTKTPIPRYDLLKRSHYVHPSVQFSRGCPFTCEFCDIIELYGRAPRTKTAEQMLSELDALYVAGYRGYVLFVDDNLIGNKKAVKAFLPHLRDWQRERGYPFAFLTQASINMADDVELLELMQQARFASVFIGIESPNTDNLITAQKKQNTRRDLVQSIEKIYSAGITVMAGFILGFDGEKDDVAEEMVACIEAASIPICMVGTLTALPETQLWRRLVREGRLSPEASKAAFDAGIGDNCSDGLNFTPSRSRREILSDYRAVLRSIYDPSVFGARTRRMARRLRPVPLKVKFSSQQAGRDLLTVWRLFRTLLVRRRDLLLAFLGALADCIRHNPPAVSQLVGQWILYMHVGAFAHQIAARLDEEIAAIDAAEAAAGRVAAPPAATELASSRLVGVGP